MTQNSPSATIWYVSWSSHECGGIYCAGSEDTAKEKAANLRLMGYDATPVCFTMAVM